MQKSFTISGTLLGTDSDKDSKTIKNLKENKAPNAGFVLKHVFKDRDVCGLKPGLLSAGVSESLMQVLFTRSDFYIVGMGLLAHIEENRRQGFPAMTGIDEERFEFLFSLLPVAAGPTPELHIKPCTPINILELMACDDPFETSKKIACKYLKNLLAQARINYKIAQAFHTWVHDNLLFISPKDGEMRKRLGYNEKKKFTLGKNINGNDINVFFQINKNPDDVKRPFKPIITRNDNLPLLGHIFWINKFYLGTHGQKQSERMKMLDKKYLFTCCNKENGFSCRICNHVSKILALV